MKLRTVLIQNILLILGVAAIYEFRGIERLYFMFQSRESGFPPLLDGDYISLSLLGFQLNEEGVRWTNAMTAGYMFLTIGIIALLISFGMLAWKAKSNSSIQ